MELKKVSIFSEFTDEEIAKVAAIAQKASVIRGDYAFTEGDAGDSIIIINMGTLKLTKRSSDGEDADIAQLGSGSYLGEMSLFDDGKRSVSGLAVENCDLTLIPIEPLRTLLGGKDQAMAAKFYRRLAMGIAHRLKNVNQDIAALKSFMSGGHR